MRRSNGTGGVFKLSGNRRKPWQARVTDGWADGKQIYRTIGYYATKAEAENAIALDRVMPTSADANITLAALFERWKATRAYTDISKHTQENYNTSYKYMSKYQKDSFRSLRLAQFQDMIDVADRMGRSRSTMEKIKVLAVLLSKYAVSEDIQAKNYAVNIRLPREEKRKAALPTFSDMEIRTLFANQTVPIVDTILILIYTGMRIRELLTLTRFHVDIENMLITGGSKTEAGTDRIIPIHPKIQPLVLARYNQGGTYLIEYEKTIGSKHKGTTHTVAAPYKYDHYLDLYYATLDKLGIRRLTPHKARHTFFTMLSARCKDRKAMALVGGHSDPNFTDQTYVQPDIDRLRKAIETI